MKNNKFSYLLIAAIFFYLTGCEGSGPVPESTEKKDARNQSAITQKKEAWKGGSPETGKKPSEKSITKKRPMSG